MACLVDAAHASLAEKVEEDMLAQVPLRTRAGEDDTDLVGGQQAEFDEFIGQEAWIVGTAMIGEFETVELFCLHEPMLAKGVEKSAGGDMHEVFLPHRFAAHPGV